MKDREISSKQFTSIDDIPDRPKWERKYDFHAMIPASLYERFEAIAKNKGYQRSELLCLALEAFLNNKRVN